MDLGSISKRYAKALLTYAVESEAEDIVYAEVQTLCQNLLALPDLQKAMGNPIVTREKKLELLKEAAGGNASIVFERFLWMVLERKRERQLLFMMHSYIDLYRRRKNLFIGKLTTAAPITDETETNIRRQLEQAIAANIEFNTNVDPAIVGGFILQVESYRVDASVSGQLQRIRKQFNELNNKSVVKTNKQ